MFSLLNKSDQTPKDTEPNSQVFFLDLNLDQILEKVTVDWGEDTRAIYDEFPDNSETEDYRREIYRDIKKPEVYSAMTEYYGKIKERKLFAERGEKAYETLQTQAWYLRETCSYIDTMEALKESLERSPLSSEGMKGFLAFISGCVLSNII